MVIQMGKKGKQEDTENIIDSKRIGKLLGKGNFGSVYQYGNRSVVKFTSDVNDFEINKSLTNSVNGHFKKQRRSVIDFFSGRKKHETESRPSNYTEQDYRKAIAFSDMGEENTGEKRKGLISEIATYGSLDDFLQKLVTNNINLDERALQAYKANPEQFIDVVIKRMHHCIELFQSLDYIHADVAPRNFLVYDFTDDHFIFDKDGEIVGLRDFPMKISDFGMSMELLSKQNKQDETIAILPDQESIEYNLALLPDNKKTKGGIQKLEDNTVYIQLSKKKNPDSFKYIVKDSDGKLKKGKIKFDELKDFDPSPPLTIEKFQDVKQQILDIAAQKGHVSIKDKVLNEDKNEQVIAKKTFRIPIKWQEKSLLDEEPRYSVMSDWFSFRASFISLMSLLNNESESAYLSFEDEKRGVKASTTREVGELKRMISNKEAMLLHLDYAETKIKTKIVSLKSELPEESKIKQLEEALHKAKKNLTEINNQLGSVDKLDAAEIDKLKDSIPKLEKKIQYLTEVLSDIEEKKLQLRTAEGCIYLIETYKEYLMEFPDDHVTESPSKQKEDDKNLFASASLEEGKKRGKENLDNFYEKNPTMPATIEVASFNEDHYELVKDNELPSAAENTSSLAKPQNNYAEVSPNLGRKKPSSEENASGLPKPQNNYAEVSPNLGRKKPSSEENTSSLAKPQNNYVEVSPNLGRKKPSPESNEGKSSTELMLQRLSNIPKSSSLEKDVDRTITSQAKPPPDTSAPVSEKKNNESEEIDNLEDDDERLNLNSGSGMI